MHPDKIIGAFSGIALEINRYGLPKRCQSRIQKNMLTA